MQKRTTESKLSSFDDAKKKCAELGLGAMRGPSLLPPGYIEAQVHERFARLAEVTLRS